MAIGCYVLRLDKRSQGQSCPKALQGFRQPGVTCDDTKDSATTKFTALKTNGGCGARSSTSNDWKKRTAQMSTSSVR
eukprot:scaffold44029_cov53-Cyclotella_meneghiniana.AAC.1